MAVQKDYFDK